MTPLDWEDAVEDRFRVNRDRIVEDSRIDVERLHILQPSAANPVKTDIAELRGLLDLSILVVNSFPESLIQLNSVQICKTCSSHMTIPLKHSIFLIILWPDHIGIVRHIT